MQGSKERLILQNKPTQRTSFIFNACLDKGSFKVEVSYSTLTKRLYGRFEALRLVSTVEALESFLGDGGLVSDLKDCIGSLGVVNAFVEFETGKNSKIKLFSLTLEDNATVDFQRANLTSLRVDYIAAQLPQQTQTDPNTSGQSAASSGNHSILNVVGTFGAAIFTLRSLWKSPDPTVASTVEVSVQSAVQDKPLQLHDLMTMLGWEKTSVQITTPAKVDSGSFWDASIDWASGGIAFEKQDSTNKKVMKLDSLDIVVHTNQDLRFDPVTINHISAVIKYQRPNPLEAKVAAILTLSDSVSIALLYSKETIEGASIRTFKGNLASFDGAKPGFKSIVAKYSSGGAPDLLNEELQLASVDVKFILDQQLTIEASIGQASWKFNMFDSLQCELTEMSGQFIRHFGNTKGYEVNIQGKMQLQSFVSASASLLMDKFEKSDKTEAHSKALLRAALKSANGNQDCQTLVSSLSNTSQSDVFPKDTKSLSFGSNELSLVIDSASKVFLLAGELSGVGSALIMIQKNAGGKSRYFIFLNVVDLSALWPDLKEALCDMFTFKQVTVQFSSEEFRVGDFRSQLSLLQDSTISDRTIPHKTTPDKTTPDKTTPEKTTSDKDAGKRQLDATNAVKLATDDTRFPKGVCFAIEIAFDKDSPITGMLSLFVPDGQTVTLKLNGAIPPEGAKAGKLTVAMSDLLLFTDAINLQSSGGIYHAATKTISVFTQLTLKISDNNYVFNVHYTTSPDNFLFDVGDYAKEEDGVTRTATPHPLLKDPFGGSLNLSMTVTKFTGKIPRGVAKGSGSRDDAKKSSAFILEGNVSIGDFHVDGTLQFEGGTPQSIKLHCGDISIAQIYDEIIRPAPGDEWPADFDLLSFHDVTMEYRRDAGASSTTDSTPLEPRGLSLRAKVDLFNFPFDALLNIAPDKTGVYMAAWCTIPRIDLFFMRISTDKLPITRDSPHFETPSIEIQSVTVNGQKKVSTERRQYHNVASSELTSLQRIFRFTVLVSFLRLVDTFLTLQYEPGKNKRFIGELQNVREMEELDSRTQDVGHVVVKPKQLRIVYENGHFKFTDLSMDAPFNVDIAKFVKDAQAKQNPNNCRPLDGLDFGPLIKTHCRWSVDLDKFQDKTLYLKVKVTVELRTDVFKDPIVELDLPMDAVITFTAETFTIDGLVHFLATAVLTNLPKIGEELLKHPEKTILIIGKIAVDHYGLDLIQALRCRGLGAPNVNERYTFLTKPPDPPPTPAPEPKPNPPVIFVPPIIRPGGGPVVKSPPRCIIL